MLVVENPFQEVGGKCKGETHKGSRIESNAVSWIRMWEERSKQNRKRGTKRRKLEREVESKKQEMGNGKQNGER